MMSVVIVQLATGSCMRQGARTVMRNRCFLEMRAEAPAKEMAATGGVDLEALAPPAARAWTTAMATEWRGCFLGLTQLAESEMSHSSAWAVDVKVLHQRSC